MDVESGKQAMDSHARSSPILCNLSIMLGPYRFIVSCLPIAFCQFTFNQTRQSDLRNHCCMLRL